VNLHLRQNEKKRQVTNR